jgi:hypothetical protein
MYALGLVAVALALAWFLGVGLLARRLEGRAEREWQASFGDAGREVLEARYGATDERGREGAPPRRPRAALAERDPRDRILPVHRRALGLHRGS